MKIIFVQLKQLKQLKSKRDTKSRGSLFFLQPVLLILLTVISNQLVYIPSRAY